MKRTNVRRRLHLRWLLVALALLAPVTGAAAATPTRGPARGPLRVLKENPRYFTDGSGRAVYLTGSHTWSNLVDMGTSDPPPRFDFDAHLDWLARLGHNFTRGWTWELVSWDTRANGEDKRHTAAPHPWARTGPGEALDGKPRFDLTKYDPAYFDRLHSRVKAAGDRGIYMSVMLFEGWGLQFVDQAWKAHPFNPANNINGIDGDHDHDGKGLEVHELVDPKVLEVQEAYVRKVVDTVNDLDNVLYEISNENHPPSTRWQYHMIDLVHSYEKGKPKQHPVGMTFQYKDGKNQDLFDSPADWVSPNPDGGYRDDPPPADGKKVVLNDTDHLWGIGGSVDWVWKSFTRGYNPLFMDPYDGEILGKKGDSRWEEVRRSLGVARAIAEGLDLVRMTPRGDLAETGYCLADPGKEYLVYLPKGGATWVNLPKGDLRASWIDPKTGEEFLGEMPDVAGRAQFKSDLKGAAVLHLRVPMKISNRTPDDYQLGPDSQPKDGIPHGKVEGPLIRKSTVFPDTIRQYWIYVPAQYDAAKPACVMVFQDGHKYVDVKAEYRVPVVFDNLIAAGEMPVTIGIFINPGHKGAEVPADGWKGSNRSFEYDSLGDQYARFLLEEVLPEVGKKYNLTQDPEGRTVCGVSSGGICAFTVAWEKPDAFRKVVSHIGSFTNIRGGHVYPALIRKTAKKPLRVFLQDGSNDLDNEHGNWPLANQEMALALKFKSYDHRFEFGDGGHTHKHGGMLFPETMRWLWRGYTPGK